MPIYLGAVPAGQTLKKLTRFWNNILTAAEKTQESLPKFRTTIKEKLLSMKNEINFF